MKRARNPLVAAMLASCLGTAHGQLTSTEKADIGLTALQLELGASIPDGGGVSVTQVEAPESGTNYRPDTTAFTGKSFLFPSGGSTTPSSHATTVGQYFYGANSIAPAAGATASSAVIASYEANNWIGSGFLKTGASALPAVETNAVQNHSWIGSSGVTATDTEILRRADYAIHRDDYVMVTGLNNGVGALPNLMASNYNGISVGLSNGSHSYGLTSIDGSGRSKPDIVAPISATSYATGTVSGAAAMLIDAAASTASPTNAAKHETVKALLLNGATKNAGDLSGTWAHTTTAPLDPVFGAGELNIQNSYHNLMAGEQNASNINVVGLNGWDYGTQNGGNQAYYFQVPVGYTVDLTATLTWDRIVTDSQAGPGVALVSALANMDLFLYSASGFTLGSLFDESISSVDNVELLFTHNLSAGTYALVTNTDASGVGQNYGFAWSTTLTAVPEPSCAILWLFAACPLLVRRRRSY